MKSCNNYLIKSLELFIFWMPYLWFIFFVVIKSMDSIWGYHPFLSSTVDIGYSDSARDREFLIKLSLYPIKKVWNVIDSNPTNLSLYPIYKYHYIKYHYIQYLLYMKTSFNCFAITIYFK